MFTSLLEDDRIKLAPSRVGTRLPALKSRTGTTPQLWPKKKATRESGLSFGSVKFELDN
jgi:hypothetical protein